jgi:elongation factor P hydroxylase
VAPATLFEAPHLERLFDECFAERWGTRLIGGAEEPYYQPATTENTCHLLYYRCDYFASALHEIAHWCIAGERRRTLPDFGYWYAPDGRSPQQQRAFEAVEAKPQALEWLFSLACGYRFYVSADNLGAADSAAPDNTAFKQQVLAQARYWQEAGLPPRARLFYDALAREFVTGLQPADLDLRLTGLAG